VFYFGTRPAIIVSSLDLTRGVLGLRRTGIQGYAPDSARDLMANLVAHLSAESRPAPQNP